MNEDRVARRLVAVLACLQLLDFIDRSILKSLLTPIGEAFALDDAALGDLNAAFLVGYMFASPVFAYLGDRTARKRLVIGGVLVWSAATVAAGLAESYWQLMAARMVVAVGEASFGVVGPSLIADSIAGERRGRAVSVFYAAIPVGYALGYVLGDVLGGLVGWRAAFWIVGGPGLFLAFLMTPFREPVRGASDGVEAGPPPTVGRMLGVLRLPDYRRVVAGYCLYTGALGAYAHWGTVYLERAFAMEDAGTRFGLVLLGPSLVGTIGGGWLAARWRRREPSAYSRVAGLSSLAAAPITAAAFYVQTPGLCLTLMGLAILLIFVATGPVGTLLLEVVPPGLRCTSVALSIFLIHALGDAWTPSIVGRVSDGTGSLRQALYLLPLLLAAGGCCWLAQARIERRRDRA